MPSDVPKIGLLEIAVELFAALPFRFQNVLEVRDAEGDMARLVLR
jgi:hypothetical protein